MAKEEENNDEDERVLPMLASSYPGFVCYVEETTPGLGSHLSTVKSSMTIAWSVVKDGLIGKERCGHGEEEEEEWFHIAVMPCHNKKLEAGRKDLMWDGATQEDVVPDVVLVITTDDLVEVLVDVSVSSSEVEKGGRRGAMVVLDDGGDCIMEGKGDIDGVGGGVDGLNNSTPSSKEEEETQT